MAKYMVSSVAFAKIAGIVVSLDSKYKLLPANETDASTKRQFIVNTNFRSFSQLVFFFY